MVLDTPLAVIPGLKAVYDRAAQNKDFGIIKIRTIESERRPDDQVIAIIPEARSIYRDQFEALVASLFPRFGIRTEWHTRINDFGTIVGLVAMQLIRGES